MNWFAITLLAYFLLGLEIILNKFLLSSKRVSHPAIYAFYSGATGLFALVFIPFGFHGLALSSLMLHLIAGVIFIYGMLALFYAIDESEASRVMPVIGAVVPIVTFFLSMVFLKENLYPGEIMGILALIAGGLWISYDFHHEKRFKLFSGFYYSVLSGILLAVAAVFFKSLYNQDSFTSVYIWTRIGGFIGVLTFLAVPRWRRMIASSVSKFSKPEKSHKQSGMIFILARAVGGAGSIIKEKATSLATASVTIVNALVSTQYIFIFILGLVFSFWLPQIFKEKKDWKSVAQKIIAIIIITSGLILVAGK